MVLQPGVYLGPVAYTLGLAASALRDLDAATRHFEAAAAIDACRRTNARSFLFKVYLAEARSRIDHCQRDPHARADAWAWASQRLQPAEQLARELGCEPWLRQVQALVGNVEAAKPRAALASS